MSYLGVAYLEEPAGDGPLVGDAPVVAVGTGVALLAHTHHVVPAERRILQGTATSAPAVGFNSGFAGLLMFLDATV